MMKKLLISVAFFLLCLPLFSQEQPNYFDYHKACRRAEKLFIDTLYKECLNTYDSTFEKYDFVFPRDCFIAAQIAFKIGNDSIAVEYLKRAVPFGLNADMSIKNDTSLLLHKIYYSKYWSSYVNDYDSLRNLYIKRVDWGLKKKLDEITFIDQKWRVQNNKWFNRNFRKYLEKGFNIDNKKHIEFLDSIFKIKGFPGVWLTGVGDSNNIAYNNNKNLSPLFTIILYHYDSAYVKFGPFLLKEVELGHIDPREYAMIRDFSDRHLVKKDKNEKMYYNIWWEAKNYTKKEFAQHCFEIGCPTKIHLRWLNYRLGADADVFWLPFR